VGTQSTVQEELARLSRELDRAWDLPLLAAQPLASTDALLALLESVERPSVLVLDEFPYLVRSDPSLPGKLQEAWDRSLHASPLKLVVCGSSIGMMEEIFLSRRAPLFGPRTGQLRLSPLAPEWVGVLLPRPPVEVVEIAALFGGVPGYLRRLDANLTPLENLRKHVLTPGEPLFEEVGFLLREELREPRVYQAVLAVISSGATRFGEISSKVGLDGANLSRYLATLAELGLVEREVPVTERRPDKSRRGRYRIVDPFVATWYAFVHPNRDRLERGYVDEVVEQRIQPGFQRWLGGAVEPVLRELWLSSLADLVPFSPAHVGSYWSPTAQFDAVLLDEERRRAFVVEVKWRRGPTSVALLDDLRRRVGGEAAFDGIETTFALVSRAGFTGQRPLQDDERLIDVTGIHKLR
jgi:AAA+ ATPase superfamily predicted ATPase